jgi:hypothetical protein
VGGFKLTSVSRIEQHEDQLRHIPVPACASDRERRRIERTRTLRRTRSRARKRYVWVIAWPSSYGIPSSPGGLSFRQLFCITLFLQTGDEFLNNVDFYEADEILETRRIDKDVCERGLARGRPGKSTGGEVVGQRHRYSDCLVILCVQQVKQRVREDDDDDSPRQQWR